MAAQGENEQAEAEGASNAVWPPPPTCTPVEAARQRRLLLPVYLALPQMPRGFDLPQWGKTAGNYLFIAPMIVLLLSHVPVVGKIMVGFLVALMLLVLFALAFSMTIIAVMFVGRKIGRTTEEPPPQWWKEVVLAAGGWMGLVPNAMFLVWGLSYLDIHHIPRISFVALVVWGSWFLLGCGVAVVNGVGQWWRERRTSPPETGDE